MANEVALLSPGSHSASDVEAAAGDAQAFRAQLRGRGDLLELRVAGDGTCDIRPASGLTPFAALPPQILCRTSPACHRLHVALPDFCRLRTGCPRRAQPSWQACCAVAADRLHRLAPVAVCDCCALVNEPLHAADIHMLATVASTDLSSRHHWSHSKRLRAGHLARPTARQGCCTAGEAIAAPLPHPAAGPRVPAAGRAGGEAAAQHLLLLGQCATPSPSADHRKSCQRARQVSWLAALSVAGQQQCIRCTAAVLITCCALQAIHDNTFAVPEPKAACLLSPQLHVSHSACLCLPACRPACCAGRQPSMTGRCGLPWKRLVATWTCM
jgi:hypothetical protein